MIFAAIQAATGGANMEFAAAWALVGAALGAALSVIGAGLGIGRLGSSAMDAMARQPEIAGRIQTGALILAALIEGVTLFAIVVTFVIQSKFTF